MNFSGVIQMKIFNSKNKKILINLICLIIFTCVISTLFISMKAHKFKNTDTYIVPENISNSIGQDIAGEEINIEDLENFIEEAPSTDSIVDEKDTSSQSNKSNVNSNNKNTSSNKGYYIKVNYGANVVTIYTSDNDGNYSIPVKAMVCSTGTATPKSGTYRIQSRWEWLGLIGNVYGHYSTQIVGNILFHSVPYLEKYNPASLEYWEYDKLGTRASAGCIRLTIADAKWIYNNIPRGTLVEFYSSSDPGPLRKTFCTKDI